MRWLIVLVTAVAGVSCARFQAPPPRDLGALASGRAKLVTVGSWNLPMPDCRTMRDSIIVGEFLYVLFEDGESTLLKVDLGNPEREPERVFSRIRVDPWGAILAQREGKPQLACGDPGSRETASSVFDSIALGDGKRQVFHLRFEDPFFARMESVPYWFPPHSARLDLIVGLFREGSPQFLTRVKGVDSNPLSLCRQGDLVWAAYTDNEKWLYAMGVTAEGSASIKELGESDVREPLILNHEGRWVLSYVQGYRTLGIRCQGEGNSLVRKFEKEISEYAAVSTGNSLVVVADAVQEGLVALSRDARGDWKEYRLPLERFRNLKLLVRAKQLLLLGRVENARLELLRVELPD